MTARLARQITGVATLSTTGLPVNGATQPWVLPRLAIILLASCDMRTLYLRNVPDEVVERLGRLAARDGTSVGAVAVRELREVSRRADNPELLGELDDVDIDTDEIVAALDAERSNR